MLLPFVVLQLQFLAVEHVVTPLGTTMVSRSGMVPVVGGFI